MATNEGALADPSTRRALARSAAFALLVFAVALALLVVGVQRYTAAARHQDDLVRDGEPVSGLILTVDQPVPGIDRVTFSYPTDDGRARQTLIAFNDYERGQRVTAYVAATGDEATLPGETPQGAMAWLVTVACVLIGIIGVPLATRRLLRAARTWTVLREHPWSPWTMRGVYPKRRRLAVAADGATDEHLVRLDQWASRRLAKLERKSPLFLAGSGRWFVVTPTEGKRLVALGRMDEPYERLSLVNPGAAADRFDPVVDEDGEIVEPDEVF